MWLKVEYFTPTCHKIITKKIVMRKYVALYHKHKPLVKGP